MAFNFGQAGTGGFSFGAPQTPAAGSMGFSAPAGGGFSLGTQAQTQSSGNPSSQTAGLLAQPTQSNESTQGGLGFGAQMQSTSSSGGFCFGGLGDGFGGSCDELSIQRSHKPVSETSRSRSCYEHR
ncbi:nuclear pore glycoprotein p62-like isoform X1 [Carassius auratus]|uniref:Nuclear pore glycoprotein p62-like isoform X1 n=1 Tax=Carassius auratus TaxID=7957 RepID=A0A6P6QPQ5_CARAU|nr:nuclear pore glycoprotein p62-like isoform X1 [Carassius auratus]